MGRLVGLVVLAVVAWWELQPGAVLWGLLYDQSIRTFSGHSDSVKSVAFAPDGRTALSGSKDNTLKLWKVPTGLWARLWAVGAMPDFG